jgi:hypothetical protein
LAKLPASFLQNGGSELTLSDKAVGIPIHRDWNHKMKRLDILIFATKFIVDAVVLLYLLIRVNGEK